MAVHFPDARLVQCYCPKQNVAYCNIKIYTLLPLKIEK